MTNLINRKGAPSPLILLTTHLKQYTKKTRDNYRADLQQLLDYCQLPICDITEGIALAWVESMKEGGKSPATIHRRISSCRSLFKVLRLRGLIDSNPFANIKQPNPRRGQNKQSRYLTDHEISLIWKGAKTDKDKCILALLLYGGLRRSEVTALNVEDIKTHRDILYVDIKNTKSGPDQTQPLNGTARDFILAYVGDRTKGALVTNRSGDRLSYDGLRKWWVKLLDTSGVERCSLHTTRVTAINTLIHKGYNAFAVMKFARHSSILATEKYFREVDGIQGNAGLDLDFNIGE